MGGEEQSKEQWEQRYGGGDWVQDENDKQDVLHDVDDRLGEPRHVGGDVGRDGVSETGPDA
ncbi:hypothetical protein CVT25_013576 [Psilocybe cyanescens]|uniref:Uncharacterized protein n=1 Tax=Psilocybe cyanescens TaxID=93625 RepID=A0A409XT62_PSICY|nr:hypothetical protein CVT25_013576 [Psilocybe cyanescens]